MTGEQPSTVFESNGLWYAVGDGYWARRKSREAAVEAWRLKCAKVRAWREHAKMVNR